MKLSYIQGGLGVLLLTGAIVVGCGGASTDDGGDGGKGGADSSGGKGGKGGTGGGGGKGGTAGAATGGSGGKGGQPGTGGDGGKGGALGTGGAAGGGMGGSAGGMGGSVGGMGGAAGSTPDAGVDAPVVVQDAAPDTNQDAAPLAPGLLVHEPFGAVGRLSGSAAGSGWRAPWEVNSDDATMAGYQVVNTTPLTYMTLRTTPTYAIGGQVYRESGRGLDVSAEGPFKDFLSAPNTIGAAGKSLWVSFLVRRDTTGDDGFKVAFHSSNAAFWDGDEGAPTTFGFGFYEAASKTGDTRYWSLRLRNSDTPVKTPLAITPGETVFVVMNVAFTATGGTVSVYLNPASLGAAAPAAATAQVTSTMPLTFKSFAFYPGNSPGSAAIDEIRFGTSYAAVTPIN